MPATLPFDAAAMAWFARRADPSLALDGAWTTPNWSDGRADLEALFRLGGGGQHFLRHHRGLLPQLWERQITKALGALIVEVPGRTLERCQALLTALEGARTPRIAAVDRVTADDRDRMDLAIHCRDEHDVAHCIVIEAKLDSELSPSQLGKYLRGLLNAYPAPRQRHLWVVAPTSTPVTAKTMKEEQNEEWRFMTWRRLLINWQAALPDAPGSDTLSLFGEIWKRAGGR